MSDGRSADDQETAALPQVNPTRAEARAQERRSLVTGTSVSGRPAVGRAAAGSTPSGGRGETRPTGAHSRGAGSDEDRDNQTVTERLSSAIETAASATSGARQAFREAADRAEARSRPVKTSGKRAPRRARLTLSHVNVYSVFKLSCILSIMLFLVWMLAIAIIYGLLDLVGVIDRINSAASTIQGGESASPVIGPWLVFGVAIIIGALNMILFIAFSTVGAMAYNVCAELVGGVEVTLSERD